MKRLKWVRRLARIATVAVLLLLLVALIYRHETKAFVEDNDTIFKLVGLGIGPLLALLGFFWGLADKAELRDLSDKLGRAKQRADESKRQADASKAEVEAKVAQVKSLERDLETIADSGRLWKLRKNAPFTEYKGWKYDPSGAKVVTISLFKGGVGKTHLAANFAAYVSEKQQKPVLLIDLDYQGSLSTTMLSAAGIEEVGSSVDALFEEGASLETLNRQRIHLVNHGDKADLNGGRGLARAWIVPADYSLTQVESRLLVERVIHERAGLDERYRLAHVLLNPNVRRDYAMILIDTPPRMTLGTVNALVASHYFVAPTILDRVSSETVEPFLTQIEELKRDLELRLHLAGIVGTMTREIGLNDTELKYHDLIAATAKNMLGSETEWMVKQNLPRKKQVTDQNDLGYFLSDGTGLLRERFYDAIFDELWENIMMSQNHIT